MNIIIVLVVIILGIILVSNIKNLTGNGESCQNKSDEEIKDMVLNFDSVRGWLDNNPTIKNIACPLVNQYNAQDLKNIYDYQFCGGSYWNLPWGGSAAAIALNSNLPDRLKGGECCKMLKVPNDQIGDVGSKLGCK